MRNSQCEQTFSLLRGSLHSLLLSENSTGCKIAVGKIKQKEFSLAWRHFAANMPKLGRFVLNSDELFVIIFHFVYSQMWMNRPYELLNAFCEVERMHASHTILVDAPRTLMPLQSHYILLLTSKINIDNRNPSECFFFWAKNAISLASDAFDLFGLFLIDTQ